MAASRTRSARARRASSCISSSRSSPRVCCSNSTNPRQRLGSKIAALRRDARVAEGGALLRRYTGLNRYRGFESLSLRQFLIGRLLTLLVRPVRYRPFHLRDLATASPGSGLLERAKIDHA